MRKRSFAVLATGAVLALGVAACGDDDEGEATAGSGGANTEQTQPAEPAGGENIVVLAQDNPDLSTLVKAVTAARLGETLQGAGPYTVFAPTNAAFEKVGEQQLNQLLQPENRDQLTDVLTYHVVEGEVKAADLRDGQKLKTVQGGELTVSIEGDTVKIDDATVVKPDVDASNGVVHVINGVLTP